MDSPRGSRVGAVLALVIFGALSATLSGRYRFAPQWVAILEGALVLALVIATAFVRGALWSRIARTAMTTVIGIALLLNAANLKNVVEAVLFHPKGIDPTALILSSMAIWSANVLAFALLYWALDRGGPDARAAGAPGTADWDFPAYSSERAPPNWQPAFGDYFFLGYMTATAFSPTEAMPLTLRVKLLMTLQSVISLVTVIVVAARAINIIPSG